MRKKIIAVIGNKSAEKDSVNYRLGFEVGKALAERGYRIQSGGLQGVMQAVFEGAHSAENYVEGTTIALIPSFNPDDCNEFADISIPTGLDSMRNALVANADAVIMIGGGAGTLSEVAFAWSFYRLIIAFENAEGWSAKLANTRLDKTIRCEGEDKIYGVTTAKEAIEVLEKNIGRYTKRHKAIRPDGKSN